MLSGLATSISEGHKKEEVSWVFRIVFNIDSVDTMRVSYGKNNYSSRLQKRLGAFS